MRPPLLRRLWRRDGIGGGGSGGVGLGDGLELLQVEPDDGVDEEAGVVLGVAVGDVDDIGLELDGADPRVRELGDGGDRAVVPKAVLASGDGEAEDPGCVVEEVVAGEVEARFSPGGEDDANEDRCWYLLTQIEYEGFRKCTEYHCSILPGVFQVSLFIFYHRETIE